MAREPARSDARSDDAVVNDERERTERPDLTLNRRRYLQLGVTAVAASAGLAAGSGTARSATKRRGITFDRVVDAVDDLGMDPTGNDPIDDALRGAMDDGTLIEFPPGEYLVTDKHGSSRRQSFGLLGTGDSRSDVRLVFPSGYQEKWIQFRDEAQDILWENMTVDQTNDRETGVGCVFALQDGLQIHNVEFAGYNPGRPGGKINARVTTREGVGVIDGFVCTGGGVESSYPDRCSGVQTGGALSHYGLLTLRNADIRNMGSSAQYFTKSNGAFRLENCYFENNDNTNIRIDGGQHPDHQAWVKDCTVVLDTDNPSVEPDSEYERTRAFIAESGGGGRHPEEFGGDIGSGDLLVENLDVFVKSMPENSEYVVGVRRNHGSATFRNVNIYTEQDSVPPFDAREPDNISDDGTVELDGVSVTGPANVDEAIVVTGRDNSTVQNSCVQMYESGQDGIRMGSLSGGRIAETNITVPGRATVFDGASVDTNNVTSGDACPLPNSSPDFTDDGKTDDGKTDDGGSTLDQTLQVVADPDADAFTYSFVVEGEADLVTTGEYAASPADGGVGEEITDNGDGTVTGTGIVAGGGGDTFAFSGTVLSFSAEGPATVLVDGSAVDPNSFGLPNTFVVDGTVTDETCNYELEVTGRILADADLPGLEAEDVVGTSVISGVVDASDVDGFSFSGDIASLSLDGSARVTFEDTDG
jgi:hypothetical protein